MLIESLIVGLGVIIILLLAEIIIKNSVALSKHFGLSGTFIGLTILSIGTSIPEIAAHIIGSIDIVRNPESLNTLSSLLIGTNIGSDIFQQNFVLPLVGILGTVVVIRKNLNIEVGSLIGAALLVWIFSLGGFISRLEGFILLVAYIAYLLYLQRSHVKVTYKTENKLAKKDVVVASLLVVLCFGVMAFVTELVLDSSTILVASLPVSASFFGIILLGIASALPELTTSLLAIFRGQKDISAGILIGSNITNPLFGIGLGALISTYTIPNVVVFYDLPIKIVTAVFLYFFLMKGKDLTKKEAVLLIGLFVIYVLLRNVFFPVDF